MKSNRLCAFLLAAVTLILSATSLRAEDWKTADGKVYQDVKVIESEADTVTILHHDGGALVPLANLPPDIQKRFNYDPVKAKVAADARAKDDAENAKALQAEMDQASQMRQAGPELQETNTPETNSSPADDGDALSTAPASGDANHHSMDELAASADSLRRDLCDPTYHTMAHLVFTIHSLGPDPSDPNHHSMSEIADSGL
jgi:hypothetical protein